MDIVELKKRIAEIDELEQHYNLIPVNTRVAFINAYNHSDKFELRTDIYNMQAQKEFIESYKQTVLKKLNTLKENLNRDTTIDLS